MTICWGEPQFGKPVISASAVGSGMAAPVQETPIVDPYTFARQPHPVPFPFLIFGRGRAADKSWSDSRCTSRESVWIPKEGRQKREVKKMTCL